MEPPWNIYVQGKVPHSFFLTAPVLWEPNWYFPPLAKVHAQKITGSHDTPEWKSFQLDKLRF